MHELDEGASGVVYSGLHVQTGRRVAVKMARIKEETWESLNNEIRVYRAIARTSFPGSRYTNQVRVSYRS